MRRRSPQTDASRIPLLLRLGSTAPFAQLRRTHTRHPRARAQAGVGANTPAIFATVTQSGGGELELHEFLLHDGRNTPAPPPPRAHGSAALSGDDMARMQVSE